jgi:hypothetical protein
MQAPFFLGWSCLEISSGRDVMRWEAGIEPLSGRQAGTLENAEAHHRVESWDDWQERGWDTSQTHHMPHAERLPSILLEQYALRKDERVLPIVRCCHCSPGRIVLLRGFRQRWRRKRYYLCLERPWEPDVFAIPFQGRCWINQEHVDQRHFTPCFSTTDDLKRGSAGQARSSQ